MWDEQRLENIIKHRCIQVDNDTLPDFISYHELFEQEEQEQKNGEYLVDYIIQKRFFPNGLPKIYQGAGVDV